MELKVNEIIKLNQYTLTVIKELGRGNYGIVYEVKDSNNNSYALKRINIEDRFEITDVAIPTMFDHPNIVKAYATNINVEYRYLDILLELADFTLDVALDSLSDTISEMSEVNIETINRWISQLVSAIFQLHNIGIYHLDLANKNILIKEIYENKYVTNKLLIADFGLIGYGNKEYANVCFTPFRFQHRPPECFLVYDDKIEDWRFWDMDLDPREYDFDIGSANIDLSNKTYTITPAQIVWNIATIIYEMYTNKQLFWGSNTEEVAQSQWNIIEYGLLYRKLEEISNVDMRDLLYEMLSPLPESRPSLYEVIDRLNLMNIPIDTKSYVIEFESYLSCNVNISLELNDENIDRFNHYIITYFSCLGYIVDIEILSNFIELLDRELLYAQSVKNEEIELSYLKLYQVLLELSRGHLLPYYV